jgi:hypothetical protein
MARGVSRFPLISRDEKPGEVRLSVTKEPLLTGFPQTAPSHQSI